MTTTGTKSTKLATLLKRTAQKLVKDPKKAQKQLKKLALTLPLMALLVEEVRAAQNKVNIDANAIVGEVFPNEQELAEFISEQNLDEGQYAELEEELEGVILAKNDAGEEDDDKGAYIQQTDGGVGAEKAFGSDATGGSLSAETGAEHAAAAADTNESFELAGLFIPVPPAAFAAGVTTAGAAVAEFFAGATADTPAVVDTPTVVDATGTNLNTTLKDLQKLGVDFVSPAAGADTLNITLGATDALTSTAGVPLFGDTNRDGTISAAEDAALSVNLHITNAEQLAEVASLSNLASYGIDSVSIDLADQATLNALLADSTMAADLAAIRNSGLTVNTIDMGAAVDISQAQAATLISNGLAFAEADTVTLQASADSTHLSTSLKDLQKLGVDNVVTTLSHLDVELGTAGTLSSTGIPSFASGVDVTLNVADAAGLGEAMDATQALHVAGIDHIDLASNAGAITQAQASSMVTNGINFAADDSITLNVADIGQTISSLSGFQALGVDQLDMVASSASISMAQADTLLAAGIGFVASDDITLNAEGTHLHTSLKDLQKLGVDHVSLAADQTSVDIDMGGALSANGIPSFASGADVTLNVNSLDDVLGMAQQLHAAGIDHIKLADQNVSITSAQAQTLINAGLDIAQSHTVSLNVADANVQATLSDLQHIKAVGVDQIDLASNTAAISLSQANDLVAKDLHFANNDAVTVNVADAAGLTQALSNTAAYKAAGIDHIDMTNNVANINLGQAQSVITAGLDFATNDQVSVNVDTAGFTSASTLAADLNAAHVDNVEVTLLGTTQDDFVDSFQALLVSPTFYDEVQTLTNAGVHAGLDLGGANYVGKLEILSTDVTYLTQDGLHFAANDDISLISHGTFVANHVSDIKKIGIDHITLEEDSVDFALFTPDVVQGLKDAGLGTIDIYGSALQDLSSLAIIDKGIDFNVHVKFGTDINGLNDLLTLGRTTGDLVSALQSSGVADVVLESTQSQGGLIVPDNLAATLYDAGMLHALPAADIVIDADSSQVFATTFKAMAALGVNGIDATADQETTQTLSKVFVGLGTEDAAEIQTILQAFTGQNDIFSDGTHGALVIEQSVSDAFMNLTDAEASEFLSRLSQLGFNEVDVINDAGTQVDAFSIVAQTVNGTTTVELIGVTGQDVHTGVLDADILSKIHKA